MSEERCWNTIGVWGNRQPRCHLLEETIHCRNCSVFIQAGRTLLDRPQEQLESWTPAAPALTRQGQFFLCFRLYNEILALTSTVLEHAMDMATIHSVPGRKRDALMGLVNVRGRLEVCVSLARILQVASDDTPFTRMLMVSREGDTFVIPVSQVLGLERWQQHGREVSQGFVRTIVPLRGREVGILDEGRIFAAMRGSLNR